MLFLFIHFVDAVDWKESLNFKLDGVTFDKIDSLHYGLARAEQTFSEDIPRKYDGEDCDADPIGILHAGRNKTPKNTENTALATLQIVLGTAEVGFESRFVHLMNETTHGRIPERTRYFSSQNSGVQTEGVRMKNQDELLRKYGTLRFDIMDSASHSENLVFYALSRYYINYIQEALGESVKSLKDKPIRAVILHVHTRFDMCGGCAYSLDWELKKERGFAGNILNHCRKLNKDSRLPIDFSALVSSRQDYLVWGPSRRSLIPPPLHRIPSAASAVDYATLIQRYVELIDLQEISARQEGKQAIIQPFLIPKLDSATLQKARDGEA